MAGEFGVEKGIELRRRLDHPLAQPFRVDLGEREPLPAHRRLPTGLRRMGRNEGRIGQVARPMPPDIDQVVAVRPIAMEEDNEAGCRLAARRRDTRSVKHEIPSEFVRSQA